METGLRNRIECRESRRHCDGIAGERAGLVDGPSGASCSMISRRPPNAPTGMPPPTILPSVVRSGFTP